MKLTWSFYIVHSLVKIKYCPPRLSKDQEENRWKHQREEDDDQTLQRRNQPAGNPALPHYQKDVSVMLHVCRHEISQRMLKCCKKINKKKPNNNENLTLECIKTAVFDTRNPKSPTVGPPPTPPPPTRSLRSLDARSIRSLAKLSSSFFQIFPVSSLCMLCRLIVEFSGITSIHEGCERSKNICGGSSVVRGSRFKFAVNFKKVWNFLQAFPASREQLTTLPNPRACLANFWCLFLWMLDFAFCFYIRILRESFAFLWEHWCNGSGSRLIVRGSWVQFPLNGYATWCIKTCP